MIEDGRYKRRFGWLTAMVNIGCSTGPLSSVVHPHHPKMRQTSQSSRTGAFHSVRGRTQNRQKAFRDQPPQLAIAADPDKEATLSNTQKKKASKAKKGSVDIEGLMVQGNEIKKRFTNENGCFNFQRSAWVTVNKG